MSALLRLLRRAAPRRSHRRAGRVAVALTAAAVVLAVLLAQHTAGSAFTATTADGGNRVSSAALEPVTGLSAAVRCTAGAPPVFVRRVAAVPSGSTLRFTVPAGTLAGDLVVVHLVRDTSTAPTAPDGFTLLRDDTATGVGSWVYQRVAAAGDAGQSHTWTVAGTTGTGVLSTYRGGAGPVLASEASGQASASGSTATMPSVTAGVAGSTLVLLVGALSNDPSHTTPAGMVVQYQLATGGTALSGFTEGRPAAGATGERVSNLGAPAPLAAVGLLVRPAPPAAEVDLAWTASSSAYADGYAVRRDGAAAATLAGRGTTTWTDTAAGPGEHTWEVLATAGTWRSAPAPVTATVAC